MPIRLFLIDDHKLLTDAWTAMLGADTRFEVTGATNNSATALAFIKELKPEIVLLDINMTPVNGVDLTRAIKEYNSQIGVIVVTYHDLPVYYTKIMKAGANGYVTKTSASEELVEAILQVAKGNNYTCNEMGHAIIENMMNPSEMVAAIKSLTPKQLAIIDLVKKGFSSKEIAGYLGVSAKTIEVHRYNILKKLGLRNSASLINEMNLRGI